MASVEELIVIVAPEFIQLFAATILKLLALGDAVTSSVKLLEALIHPFALVTVMVPPYEFTGALAGTVILIGLAGNAELVTVAKPADVAAAFHVML